MYILILFGLSLLPAIAMLIDCLSANADISVEFISTSLTTHGESYEHRYRN